MTQPSLQPVESHTWSNLLSDVFQNVSRVRLPWLGIGKITYGSFPIFHVSQNPLVTQKHGDPLLPSSILRKEKENKPSGKGGGRAGARFTTYVLGPRDHLPLGGPHLLLPWRLQDSSWQRSHPGYECGRAAGGLPIG